MSSPRRKSILDLAGFVGIQGLINAINKLAANLGTVITYSFADNETPAGTINGTNKVFTLVNTPDPATSLDLRLGGVYMTAGGEDYTLVNKTITFVEAPYKPADSTPPLRAFYRY